MRSSPSTEVCLTVGSGDDKIRVISILYDDVVIVVPRSHVGRSVAVTTYAAGPIAGSLHKVGGNGG